MSSKLAIKNIFHQKCVYMLNDFFDDRKNQCCVQVLESSWFVWNFEVDRPYFWKRYWLSGPKNPGFCQCIWSQSETASQPKFSQMWLPTLWEMWNTMYPHYEDNQSDWWDNNGPKGRPKNLQSAWRLAELFFWSDLSWSQANLCSNSYEISTHFSLLSTMPSCTCYIYYIGILPITRNVLFRISIIFDNMAIWPCRFSSYLWLFVFLDFWITCTYRLILFSIFHLIVFCNEIRWMLIVWAHDKRIDQEWVGCICMMSIPCA